MQVLNMVRWELRTIHAVGLRPEFVRQVLVMLFFGIYTDTCKKCNVDTDT